MKFVVPQRLIESTLPDIITHCARNEAYGETRPTPYLWRARRPSGTVKGMIAASLSNNNWQEFWRILQGKGESYVVLDPMAGNGTTAREAASMGLRGIAGDINIVACINMVASYQSVPEDIIEQIKAMIPDTVYEIYSTKCELCGRSSPITMRIWGSLLRCPDGHVFLSAPDWWENHLLRQMSPYKDLYVSRTEKCWCGKRARFSLRDNQYTLLAISYNCPVHGKADKVPDSEDLAKIEECQNVPVSDFFNEEIPEDWKEYRSRGFERAHDLFHPGTHTFLDHAIKIAGRFDCKMRLLLSLADAIRSSSRLSKISHDTFLPFSGKAVFHPHSAELSPVSGMGRTWISLLRRPSGEKFEVVLMNAAGAIPLPSSSVDAVVTDPPYYDYISYHSSAYLAYLVLFLHYTPVQSEIGKSNFALLMSRVFSECFRVLRPGGVISFTFRHPDYAAWRELGKAILDAGGVVSAVHAVQNDSDIRMGRKIAMRDAVIVCARRNERELLSISPDEAIATFDTRDICGAIPASIMALSVNQGESISKEAFERAVGTLTGQFYQQLSLL